jgi:Tubulin like
MAAVDEKSMVPTVLVGVGGTGYEVLARVRRLVEETYGKLENFPILGFLIIDTDKDYKVNNPEAAGSPFKDNEKYWARVAGKQAQNIVENMGNFPWIQKWFPNELEKSLTALEAGAGQIRACGRFAFFFNYSDIKKSFNQTVRQLKGHENFMLDRYGIKVGSGINVFVTGSLSGGTGSGMMLDLGYCIKDWLKGEQSVMLGSVSWLTVMPLLWR